MKPNAVYEQGNVLDPMPNQPLTLRGALANPYTTTRFAPYRMTSEETAQDIYTSVLAGVGPRLPVVDSVTQRILDDVANRVDRQFWVGQNHWPVERRVSWPNL